MKNNLNEVRFALVDLSVEGMEGTFTTSMVYDREAIAGKTFEDLMLRVSVGDVVSNASVTVPIGMLRQAVEQLMRVREEKKNSGLVGFGKPGIVGIN